MVGKGRTDEGGEGSVVRKKWQAKGKAPQTELEEEKPIQVYLGRQTAKMVQGGRATQTEVTLEELGEAIDRRGGRRKGGERAKDREDIVMKDGSGDLDRDRYREYKDLSNYEEDGEALVVAPQTGCSTSDSKTGWEETPTGQNTPTEFFTKRQQPWQGGNHPWGPLREIYGRYYTGCWSETGNGGTLALGWYADVG